VTWLIEEMTGKRTRSNTEVTEQLHRVLAELERATGLRWEYDPPRKPSAATE
jgi:hypothetical protein